MDSVKGCLASTWSGVERCAVPMFSSIGSCLQTTGQKIAAVAVRCFSWICSFTQSHPGKTSLFTCVLGAIAGAISAITCGKFCSSSEETEDTEETEETHKAEPEAEVHSKRDENALTATAGNTQ